MLEVLLAFLRLGCMSFGGPAAHLAYFRDEFVRRRGWLSEAHFAQCISITQLLPGPASSQTGMLIGLLRAGWGGAVAAWIGFTLPSAALMTAFAIYQPHAFARLGWLHGLLVVAVAVVAQAILTMRRALIADFSQLVLAFGTCAAMLLLPYPATAPAAIGLCAATGLFFTRGKTERVEPLPLCSSRKGAVFAAGLFLALLIGLGAAARASHDPYLTLASRLYQVGSLVFGGGHVVLPLLHAEVVHSGMASSQKMIAGYAAAQAMPGPLFTLSSYVGAMVYDGALGVRGALVATLAIFLPSFLLIAAIAPFYTNLAANPRFARALAGANASVVGLLASAFVSPIWTNAVHDVEDALFAAAAFAALTLLRWPAWIVVALAAGAGAFVFR
jgi:chromate transporter